MVTIYKTFGNIPSLIYKFVITQFQTMKEYIIHILSGFLLFLAPIQGLAISVGIAIMFDTFTGVYKSVKKKGWKSINSRTLSTIISKMLLYELCLIALFPIDFYLLNELLLNLVSVNYFATKLVCVILILVELTSIKENIEQALMIDFWKTVKVAVRRTRELSDDIDEIKN